MKKGLTEIVFILDRSGSMSGLEADTIGGFNSLIQKQRKEPGEAIVSTVLFDDRCEVIHDRTPMEDVPKMTEDVYFVRGCTALLSGVRLPLQSAPRSILPYYTTCSPPPAKQFRRRAALR